MKKRRTLVISALLVAALALGIGYAGVSTSLKISGTVASEIQKIDVAFVSVDEPLVHSADETVQAGMSADAGFTSKTLEVKPEVSGFTNEGDYVKLVYTIQNFNEYDVTLAKITIQQASASPFKITTNFPTGGQVLSSAGATGGADTFKLEVLITLEHAGADKISEDFTITVEAIAGAQE
jgi:hypothetical protein